MGNFSLGLIVGTAVGVGMIMAVNPMDKRTKRKMCHKASKMMRNINRSMHNMA